jgi:antitoxin ParD1/3/4
MASSFPVGLDASGGLRYKMRPLLFFVIGTRNGGTATMNVSLPPSLEDLVKGKVDSGLYNSASDVMREALCLLEERDRLRERRLDELRRDIQVGIDSGESTPLDIQAIKARGRRRLAAQSGQG